MVRDFNFAPSIYSLVMMIGEEEHFVEGRPKDEEPSGRIPVRRGVRPRLVEKVVKIAVSEGLRAYTPQDGAGNTRQKKLTDILAQELPIREAARDEEAAANASIAGKKERVKKTFHDLYHSALAQSQVLMICREIRGRMRGRNPTPFQILAVTVLEHGLDSEQLTAHAKALSRLHYGWKQKKTDQRPWNGSPPHPELFGPRWTLLPRVEEILRKTPDGMDQMNLAKALGIPKGRGQILVDHALKLLAAAGFASIKPEEGRTWQAVYVHRQHILEKEPEPD
ncbi:MAG TPA: hypothetical protein VJI13_05975 [Candidatus Norongarragalinales archaeon]|nr:hypothetical protein [Candidatus Norongarragalinales archaeon]